jgi:carbon storage regulator
MLVMWRRAGESLLVGDDIDVEVLEVRPHRVKLGLSVPESIVIVRKEARLTREENVAAVISMDQGSVDSLLSRLSNGPRRG